MEFLFFPYLLDNSAECQIRMSDSLKSIKDDQKPDRRTTKLRLNSKYRDEILFFQNSGRDSIIYLNGFNYEVISMTMSTNIPKTLCEERF